MRYSVKRLREVKVDGIYNVSVGYLLQTFVEVIEQLGEGGATTDKTELFFR